MKEDDQQETDEYSLVSKIEFYQPISVENPELLEIRNIVHLEYENYVQVRKIALALNSEGASVYLDLKSTHRPLYLKDLVSYEKHLIHWVEKQLGIQIQEDSYKWIRLYRADQEDAPVSPDIKHESTQ